MITKNWQSHTLTIWQGNFSQSASSGPWQTYNTCKMVSRSLYYSQENWIQTICHYLGFPDCLSVHLLCMCLLKENLICNLFYFLPFSSHPPAMLQRWWRQQAGSPWWRLIRTWWLKRIAPWLLLSALSSDPHANASNSPNSPTGRHPHTLIQTHTFAHTCTHKNTQIPPQPSNTQGQPFPLAVTYYTTYSLSPNLPLLPHPEPAVFSLF